MYYPSKYLKTVMIVPFLFSSSIMKIIFPQPSHHKVFSHLSIPCMFLWTHSSFPTSWNIMPESKHRFLSLNWASQKKKKKTNTKTHIDINTMLSSIQPRNPTIFWKSCHPGDSCRIYFQLDSPMFIPNLFPVPTLSYHCAISLWSST